MTTASARRWRRPAVGAALGLTAILVTSGCGGSGEGTGSSSAGGQAAPAAGAGDVAGGGTGTAGRMPAKAGGAGSGSSALPPGRVLLRPGTDVDRSIVYRAELALRVRDVAAQAARATDIVTAAGGYLASEQQSGNDSDDLAFKVPAAKFTEVRAALGRLGTRLSTSASAEDVSDQVVDLTSRVATARASVARVRALLARATTVGQIVDIEGELTSRESDLESLEGRLGLLTDQVALSSISLQLTKAGHPAPAASHDRGTSFLAGLRGGWHAFTTAVVALVVVLGAVLPFAVVLALLGAAWWWGRRAVRDRRGTRAPAPAPEA